MNVSKLMQIFSLNWLSHKKKPIKKIPKKLKNARPHRHGNSLYNIYTYIYALLSKTQTTIRSTKTKNKLTKKKKHTKTPNEKPKKTHDMKRNQIEHYATPLLFTIAHFPAHVTHKTCALTNKIVSLYVSNGVPHSKYIKKTTLKLN